MKGNRSMKGGEAVHEFNGVRVVRAGGGRKDRHSKVCTARGTRDRRVRLSPNTAILFYDVQDRLGYDRPSKAIDWLMKEAKSAIEALDNPNPPTAANFNHSAAAESNLMLRFERELVKEHSINEFNPGLFNEGAAAAPPLSSLSCRREDYDEQFMYAPTPPIELFDENSKIIRMQRIFYAANASGEDYSSAAPANFFSEREPLQSSTYSRINNNSPHFQGFSFSDEELPDFCGASKFKEDGIGNSKSSSFLHFED